MYSAFCLYMTEQGMDNLIRKAGGVLVGFSGGADSSLLLFFLKKYCDENAARLYAVHIHHGIRGEAADRDEDFCRNRAAELGIPFYSCREDVPRLAEEKGIGVEEAARQVRYRYFRETAENLQNPDLPIATAHNADDNLETVLFHLCRGSGLHGLCGIPPIREKRFIRPMLPFTGEEIRDCCKRENIPYTEDQTNADTGYTRNYIRHEIVPRLKHIQPHPAQAVFRSSELLRDDDLYLERNAEEILEGASTLSRETVRDLPFVLQSRVLRKMYHGARDPECDGTLSRKHIADILRCITGEGSRYILHLPDKVEFRLENGRIGFFTEEEKHPVEKAAVPVFFPDGEGIFENECYVMVLSRKNQQKATSAFENIYKLSIQQTINFAKIKGVMSVRYRLPGDTIRYGGMTRKVKKLLSEKHLPEKLRNCLPVLTDEEGIVWLPGFPVREETAGTDSDDLTVFLYSKTDCL
ncbi:MAG: tRNA lysidine(34) synthetase TilS [Clostridia bacterium]|nr:tRNA lysidine(34) synthetase TilS [Clostridia bacterium]